MRKPKYGLWTSSSFSPLHSGQATAITSLIVSALNAFALSVPSIRGKPLQYNSLNTKVWRIAPFSPLHSGQATAIQFRATAILGDRPFSPLHSGQATAIRHVER